MPKIGKITDIDPENDYRNNCIAGKCSNCGECCSDLLPISPDEIKRIKAYIKSHNVKMHRNNYPVMQNQLADLTCPFRNNSDKKCDIYEVRPLICRIFICSKSMTDAHKDRDIISKDRSTVSMRNVFFGDTSSTDLLEMASMIVLAQMFL